MSPTRDHRIKEASRQRRQEERLAVRKAILTAAEELLVQKGYEGFSLREVAEAVGYSPTTIYRYFEDKDHLLYHLIRNSFEEFNTAVFAAHEAAPSDLQGHLLALSDAYIEFALSHPAKYRLMFVDRGDLLRGSMQEPGPEDREEFRNGLYLVGDVIGRAVAEGKLRIPDVAAATEASWASLHGVVSLWLSMPDLTPEWVRATARMSCEAYLTHWIGAGTPKDLLGES